MRRPPSSMGPVLAVAAIACAPIATAGPGCRPAGMAVLLPDFLVEASGAAVSWRDPDAIWTHNDQGSSLYALDGAGRILAEYSLPLELRDWEDLEVSSCRESGSCVYLGDTGDNAERRPGGDVRLIRVAEPDPRASGALEVDVFPFRLPEGPRDIEALFVLPGERIHLVTKGRGDPITVYRYPGPPRPDTVTLVEVQRLTTGPAPLLAQVTGASASADGDLVAIRTYQSLEFFRMQADTLARVQGGLVNLRTLQELQGEGVGLGPAGLVVLTSEGGPLGGPASMRLLRCEVGA